MRAASIPFAHRMRSGSVFVAINAAAGLLHYLFQVFASQRLTAAEFSDLNSWFAHLALFFVLGGILQYAGNFFPAPRRLLRQMILLINFLCFGLVVVWLSLPATAAPSGPLVLRALMVLLGSSLFGWLMGQVQIRMLFTALTVANVLVGVTKLGLVLVPWSQASTLELFRFSLFACYIPALWWISVSLWRDRNPAPQPAHQEVRWELWSAPLVLSFAASLIPQMDLVLMSRIQSAEVFQDFARSSLFYKGIYFLLYIFAQWLLPQQIREKQGSGLTRASLALAAAALLGSAALTGASPFIVRWILHWEVSPPLSLIFLSCLNMSLLTWLFLLIQECCAQSKTQFAGIALAGLGVEALIQLSLGLPPTPYLTLAIVLQAGLVTYLTFKAAPAIAPRS